MPTVVFCSHYISYFKRICQLKETLGIQGEILPKNVLGYKANTTMTEAESEQEAPVIAQSKV